MNYRKHFKHLFGLLAIVIFASSCGPIRDGDEVRLKQRIAGLGPEKHSCWIEAEEPVKVTLSVPEGVEARNLEFATQVELISAANCGAETTDAWLRANALK